jgi:hypothetical protein
LKAHVHKNKKGKRKMDNRQITVKIAELSRYRESAQLVVDNYQRQIEALEEERNELLDARFAPSIPSGVAIPCRNA